MRANVGQTGHSVVMTFLPHRKGIARHSGVNRQTLKGAK
jgi:hypothetical protein